MQRQGDEVLADLMRMRASALCIAVHGVLGVIPIVYTTIDIVFRKLIKQSFTVRHSELINMIGALVRIVCTDDRNVRVTGERFVIACDALVLFSEYEGTRPSLPMRTGHSAFTTLSRRTLAASASSSAARPA